MNLKEESIDYTVRWKSFISFARYFMIGSLSYFDLVDPRSIDCSNHPMFQKACEKMERLKLTFYNKNDKTASISRAEDDLENQSFSLCVPQKKPQDTNYFYVSKDSNFGKEHFKAEIEVVDAIEYLRQFVGKFQRIDLGFRVVE